jgi:hypothetical protein
MSISTPNDFELLNVSYDNNEFNLLAKDQVGNLYRIREDFGDEDYVIVSYKSVTSLDDSFSYYVDFDSSLYGVRGYSKDEDKDLDKDLFSFLSWVYSLTLDEVKKFLDSIYLIKFYPDSYNIEIECKETDKNIMTERMGLLIKSVPLLESLFRTFFDEDVKVSSIDNNNELFNMVLTGSESLFLEGRLNTTLVYSPDIANVSVFYIKDNFNKINFEYKYRKVILSLREYFDISLQKEKLTWDVMLYKD